MSTEEAPVKGLRVQYSEATRQALIDAATRLFVAQGAAATKLADIASAANASRGAVYHHFEDKTALYEAVMSQCGELAVQKIGAAAALGKDPFDSAVLAIDAFLELCCDRTYARIVWQEGPAALGWERWRACEQQYGLGLTREMVRVLIEEGLVAPAPLETLTRIVFGMIGEAGLTVAEAPSGRAQAAARAECSDLLRRFLEGIRTG